MKKLEAAFKNVCGLLSGHDMVEEFIGAGVSPLGEDEFPEFGFIEVKFEYLDEPVSLPTLEVSRGVGENNISLVSRVEHMVKVLVGPYTEREHNSCLVMLRNLLIHNCVFEYSIVLYGERDGFKVFEDKRSNKHGKNLGEVKEKRRLRRLQ